MAKLLVLFDAHDEATYEVAQAIHEGARSVRFAESDLMRLADTGESGRAARVRPLDAVEALTTYDAIAVGGAGGRAGELARVLAEAEGLGMTGALANKLGAVFPASDAAAVGDAHPLWPLLAPMARYGMILVPPGYAGPTGQPEELPAAAHRLGKRLIDIAGWITHARSHHHH